MATATVIRAGGRDRFGDPLPASEHTVDGCTFFPRRAGEQTREDNHGASTVIVGAVLFAPVDADIVATDRIRLDGVVYDVEGEPGKWDDARGDLSVLEVALRRVTG